jgi:glutaryl-CoA dehydrogenase
MFKSVTARAARRVAQPSSFASRRLLHAPVAFDWKDPLGVHHLYTEDEAAIAQVAEDYCQERMLPRVLGASRIHHSSKHHETNYVT